MLIDHNELKQKLQAEVIPIQDRHQIKDRISPSIFQYDYLALKALYQDIKKLLTLIKPSGNKNFLAVDIGCDKSPYFELLTGYGYDVKTLDLTTEFGADMAGAAENTGLPDNSVDLIICTQVLEHTRSPWKAMAEFNRILKPEGYVLFSVPHVWFYHPHPSDYWRMTQEGVFILCEEGDFQIIELHGQGGSSIGLCQVLNFVLYGVIKNFGCFIYALLNIIAPLLDKIFPNSLFCINFSCLAQKKSP